MKKILSFLLLALLLLCFVACEENITKIDDTKPGAADGSKEETENPDRVENTYIVLEANSESLIVAEMGKDGKAVEDWRYSVFNAFYPDTKVTQGDKIVIEHNGQIMESFPARFSKIYKMRYDIPDTGETVEVIVDGLR